VTAEPLDGSPTRASGEVRGSVVGASVSGCLLVVIGKVVLNDAWELSGEGNGSALVIVAFVNCLLTCLGK
jgi:hypothetical protein